MGERDDSARLARNRARQQDLYGVAIGTRVRTLTAGLGISQACLARTIGVSPAMLSQLVSARRIRMGNPRALARLRALDRWYREFPAHQVMDRDRVLALLADVASSEWRWELGLAPVRATRTGTR
jgi:transcriptional regulator with XRE-family HTH domain